MSAVYKVRCHCCDRAFDAASARQCDCISDVRTFRCPHCAACFCQAPAEHISTFWQNAPRELWRKRSSFDELSLQPRETAARPLVLFADDVAAVRSLATRTINSMGVSTVTASNGVEAMKVAAETSPDLVILDAMMPQLDGREAARAIRFKFPHTRIVVLTGVYRDARYRVEALRDGVIDEYLTKPLTPRELRALIVKYASSPSAIPVLRERRQAQRARTVPPIDATVNGKPVYITDVSMTGIRLSHETSIGDSGTEVIIRLTFAEQPLELPAVIAWTHSHASVQTALIESGLFFAEDSAEMHDKVRPIVESHVQRALDAMKTTAGGLLKPNRITRSAPSGFQRHELIDGTWTSTATKESVQPPNGFTTRADTPDSEVDLLRQTYEAADAEGRALIRTLAELSSSDH